MPKAVSPSGMIPSQFNLSGLKKHSAFSERKRTKRLSWRETSTAKSESGDATPRGALVGAQATLALPDGGATHGRTIPSPRKLDAIIAGSKPRVRRGPL